MQTHSERISFIWGVADLIRDSFKRGKYQDVILPFTVLRRIDAVLAPTKPEVLEAYDRLKDRLDNLHDPLTRISGYDFYNTSPYDLERLAADHAGLAANLRSYINGFSENMREVLEKFDFDNTISRLDEANLLYQVVQVFRNVDLHPNRVSNLDMGYIFEDLIRRFNEALNENPGEHFTPREVVRLMVNLMVAADRDFLDDPSIIRTIYDPCCGSGGMLTEAKDRITEINPTAEVYLYGQEVNPETWAVCKSDMFIKSPKSKDADRIAFGSTLSEDGHSGRRFDYILANPPYGKDWKRDQNAVKAEAERGHSGRFGAGTPRISDGQLLFLQHMLAKMKPVEQGGSRIAIIMNGSPLFTGDAGSGESEIRRWILENDWLEALVALPEQLFYNTGIATYVWILSNRKDARRAGKVQLIDATAIWEPMRRSLGDKRRQITDAQIAEITEMYLGFEEDERSKIFPTTAFGYRKITVEQPLRLNFQATPERIARLEDERAFQNLATSRKRNRDQKEAEEADGRRQQAEIRDLLASLPGDLYSNRDAFEKLLNRQAKAAGVKLSAPVRKAILSALSERDETADVCRTKKGEPEPDTGLRDTENVPLGEDVEGFFAREVLPYVPDAWIDESKTDDLDGEVGRVGYEINFNRYFYEYTPPRPLEEIDADLAKLEQEILDMLREVVA